MRFWLIVLCLFWSQIVFSQRQNIWYFGDGIGLDFNFEKARILTDGKIGNESTDSESAAVIADETGQLLFYTDGVTVWNREHKAMPNGTGLWGSNTTTQTIIIPKPGSNKKYYIFTASPQGDDDYFPEEKRGFRYTLVDISMENGYGDVVEKNMLLEKSTTEKISATYHANKEDVWVVMHEWKNNTFRSFLITDEGISPKSVESNQGRVHSQVIEGSDDKNAIGQMKISPNGEKLALAIYESSTLEIFDFDNTTGRLMYISSFQNLSGDNTSFLYGVEFSPNSHFLYASDGSRYIYQIDLSNSPPKLNARLGSELEPINQPSALQLAPDNKIYFAQYLQSFIGAISNPNLPGESCGYNSKEIELFVDDTTYHCNFGLPNFVSSYFLDEDLYPPRPSFEMPNVFTPNGDGINERFSPTKSYNIKSAELKIYNRWGASIYEDSGPSPGWDGAGSSPGIYFWCVRYEGTNLHEYFAKGIVQLLY